MSAPTLKHWRKEKVAYIAGASSKCTKNILEANGFLLKFHEEPKSYLLGWGNPKSLRFYRNMPYEAIYFQIPGSGIFGRKDSLAKLLQNTEFHPLTYTIPGQLSQAKELIKHSLCLYKPALNARGEGIKLLSKHSKFNAKNAAVVEEYCNSLLINNYKFDLRIYVYITSVDPLCIYVYQKGIARFATTQYESPNPKSERRMFLTNYAVNRGATTDTTLRPTIMEPAGGEMCIISSEDYQSSNLEENDSPAQNNDYKWTLERIFAYLDERPQIFSEELSEKPSTIIRNEITHILQQTFLKAEPHLVSEGEVARTSLSIPRRVAALYGADFIILTNGDVELLEINVCPSSGTSTELDIDLKYPLHNTIFSMLNAFGSREQQVKSEFSQLNEPIIDYSKINRYESLVLQEFYHEQQSKGLFERILPKRGLEMEGRYLNRLIIQQLQD